MAFFFFDPLTISYTVSAEVATAAPAHSIKLYRLTPLLFHAHQFNFEFQVP